MSAETKKNAKDEIAEEMKKVKHETADEKRDKHARKEENPLQAKVAELTDDLKRVQAEFENYKKRCEKENANFRDYATAQLIKKLLTVLDSFEMAFKNTSNHEEFMKGVELIYSQFYNILRDEGLQPIDTNGKKFDAYYHEVMLSEKSDKEEGTILEELQKGYKLKNGVIRHSKVKVAK
ncbi:nucleotide exchange factor GrpE [Candidatus Woesearchaeota archaeon]|nr:nucleotide exchange factor GrpE [Candidatus Woesearchaeota archaeon]